MDNKTNRRASQVPMTKEEERAQEIYRRAQQKQDKKDAKRASGDSIADKGPFAFVKGTVRELKAVTWPTPPELLKWCLIVVATVSVLALGSMAVDTFVATPIMSWISSLNIDSDGSFDIVSIALIVVMIISGIGSIAGIYMHSGGDTEGLSDTVASKLTGGSGQAQKNLDRITLVCILVFVACLIAAMIIYPQGSIATTAQ